jgi:hypothetical protein
MSVCCCTVFSLGHLGSGRHVHAHPSEGLRLGVEGHVNVLVRLLNHGSERAAEELLLGVSSPGLSNGAVGAAHSCFEVLVLHLMAEVGSKCAFHVFVNEGHVAESEL